MDWCFHPSLPPPKVYTMMRDAINKTGRPIFFAICEWGEDQPWTCKYQMLASRIYNDIDKRLPRLLFYPLPMFKVVLRHKYYWFNISIIDQLFDIISIILYNRGRRSRKQLESGPWSYALLVVARYSTRSSRCNREYGKQYYHLLLRINDNDKRWR